MITLLLGGQYGSEAKGNVANFIAQKKNPKTTIGLNGPGAGHTAYRGETKYVFCALPIGAIEESVDVVLLGPGAVVDPDRLIMEVKQLPNRKQIYVHEAAAYVTQADRDAEKVLVRIGSTMKGTSQAMVRKLSRVPDGIIGGNPEVVQKLKDNGVVVLTASEYRECIIERNAAGDILAEGSQGFSLSLNQGGFYPYCTSRDCTTTQGLADLGIPWILTKNPNNFKVILVIRTYPIRVANRFDEQGNQIGTSGPFYDDQAEITFGDLGVETEVTTVTKLPRRIFTFSTKQIIHAVETNGVDEIAVSFMDYLKTPEDKERFLSELAFVIHDSGARIRYTTDNPSIVVDLWEKGSAVELEKEVERLKEKVTELEKRLYNPCRELI